MHNKAPFLPFLVTLLVLAALTPVESISQEQLDKMAKSMRKTCVQKVATTDELVEGLQRGEFPDDSNLACYTNCIMKMLRSFKNGAIDFAMIDKQVDMTLPPDLAARVKIAIDKCRGFEFNGEPCEITYKYTECYYKADPETFFFP